MENKSIKKLRTLVKGILTENIITETGEWDESDEELVGWKESLENDVKYIQEKTNGKLQLDSVRGFDKYQGPYANVHINNKHYEVWTSENNTLWIENFPIDNTSQKGLNPGFQGDVNTIVDLINNYKEQPQKYFQKGGFSLNN